MKGDGLTPARLRPVQGERSEAAHPAVQRVEHALGQGRGDRRVDRVAALLQDGGADLHGPGLRSNDHSRHSVLPRSQTCDCGRMANEGTAVPGRRLRRPADTTTAGEPCSRPQSALFTMRRQSQVRSETTTSSRTLLSPG